MDRRRQIRMSETELAAFLDGQRTLTCATIGPAGRPHLAALWFVPVDGRLDCWTYAASQKARNLERDPRATLLTETGTAYQELRGASMECDAELVRDPDRVLDIGAAQGRAGERAEVAEAGHGGDGDRHGRPAGARGGTEDGRGDGGQAGPEDRPADHAQGGGGGGHHGGGAGGGDQAAGPDDPAATETAEQAVAGQPPESERGGEGAEARRGQGRAGPPPAAQGG